MTMLDSILNDLRQGRFVAVMDDKDREDETDLVVAAETISAPQMAMMIRNTSGIVCVSMQEERLDQLGLTILPTENPANFETPFTMPVDLKTKTRGGVSAEERTLTIQALIDPATDPETLGRPGHVFPLRAHPGGLAKRQGHTEAALELVVRAGLYPAAVLAELLNEDGTIMRQPELSEFLNSHDIRLISVKQIMDELGEAGQTP